MYVWMYKKSGNNKMAKNKKKIKKWQRVRSCLKAVRSVEEHKNCISDRVACAYIQMYVCDID